MRPSVAVALKHKWLAQAISSTQLLPQLLFAMPRAIQGFASSQSLRRLALCAAAREADDCDLFRVRRLFQVLELQCDGALTRLALERVAMLKGPTAGVASELARCFDLCDADGSGTIDWTEVVAIALSAAGTVTRAPDGNAAQVALNKRSGHAEMVIGGQPEPATERGDGLPALREDTVLRAFDLMSQGTGAINGVSLGSLMATGEVERAGIGGWLASRSNGTCSGDPTEGWPSSLTNRVAALDRMVREVELNGNVNSASFRRLLQDPTQ